MDTFRVPWPAKLVVVSTASDGITDAYGLFDSTKEANDYIEANREDFGDSEITTALLWAK